MDPSKQPTFAGEGDSDAKWKKTFNPFFPLKYIDTMLNF